MPFLYKPTCGHDEQFAFPSFVHIVLKGNGFWPTDGDATNWLFRVLDRLYNLWNCVVICSVTLMVFSELMYIFVHFTTVSQAAESMGTVMLHAMIYIRMLHMRYAVKCLKALLGRFADKIWIKQESHPLIFEHCIRNTNPIFFITISILIALVIYVLLPIVVLLLTGQTLESTNKGLPLFLLLPYNYQIPANYIFTYIWCRCTDSSCIMQLCAMDGLFSFLISFACGQFQILHGRIMRLIPECHAEWLQRYGDVDTADVVNMMYLQHIYTERLHDVQTFHSEIIRFCAQLEEFFSFPLLVNIGCSTFVICFGGFQLLVGGRNSFGDFMRFFLYLSSLTAQLYAICNLGALLIMHSTDTARYLFMCNWEGGSISENSPLMIQCSEMELDVLCVKLPSWRHINYHPPGKDFRRNLILMIMRSYRPVHLTAMNFTVVSLETFGRILSSSLSYFALLKTFMDNQDLSTFENEL